jgi:hypothetical protein
MWAPFILFLAYYSLTEVPLRVMQNLGRWLNLVGRSEYLHIEFLFEDIETFVSHESGLLYAPRFVGIFSVAHPSRPTST